MMNMVRNQIMHMSVKFNNLKFNKEFLYKNLSSLKKKMNMRKAVLILNRNSK